MRPKVEYSPTVQVNTQKIEPTTLTCSQTQHPKYYKTKPKSFCT